ncbi:uncharacterized protein LOC132979848 [Labrus mixtus]|uniref:uncharacterized protein LOC132979848 n=1 Tax=Labrus mixtus TaxID=508554 RepID=UPI0029C00A36|nr:uncharacterized protein LOC132979848 [Labrus mixtus]
MERGTNRRDFPFEFVVGRHLKLMDLKKEAPRWGHLKKSNIPPYPRPEFHVSRLIHVTNQTALQGIREMKGFMIPEEIRKKGMSLNPSSGSLLWWSLAVGPEEVASAERRLLETTYPDRTEKQIQAQQSFLKKFASSPAFNTDRSKLGSYRFTFGLEEVLRAYSDQVTHTLTPIQTSPDRCSVEEAGLAVGKVVGCQAVKSASRMNGAIVMSFCGRAKPVMRVLRTELYRQEFIHVVVVHDPAQHLYNNHPLLTDDPDSVCTYRDGHFLWRSEAMCKTHSYQLVRRDDEMQLGAEPSGSTEFYVWDNVAVALHVDDQVLKFDVDRLRERLTFCDHDYPPIEKNIPFDSFEDAEQVVKKLWPDYPSALKRDEGV